MKNKHSRLDKIKFQMAPGMTWEEFYAAEQRIKTRTRNKLAAALGTDPEPEPGGSLEEDEKTFWRYIHEQNISNMLTASQAGELLGKKLEKISTAEKRYNT